MALSPQRLPTGAPREALRVKGQFWTPPWVAEAMVAYPLAAGATTIFDPAVGAGAFLLAARKVSGELGRQVVCTQTLAVISLWEVVMCVAQAFR